MDFGSLTDAPWRKAASGEKVNFSGSFAHGGK